MPASCGKNRGVNTTNPRPWLPITEISIEHVDGPHIWKLLTQAKQTNVTPCYCHYLASLGFHAQLRSSKTVLSRPR
eukprot:COSAG06_NODE_245_length_19176_cov_167.625151_22_plen_76_part_00